MKKLAALLFLFVLCATQAQQTVHEVSLKMNVEICDDALDLEENQIFTLIENPVSSQINVLSKVPTYYMQLWDLNGKQLSSKVINTMEASIDCSHLPLGIYIAMFFTDEHKQSFKIIRD